MDIAWERLAFSPESDWGCCLVAFLQRIYARRGAESSLVHYRQALMLFFSAPAKSPEMYTRQDVEVFLQLPGKGHGRIGRPVGPGTMNNRLSILNSFYRYATAYTVAGRDGPEPLMKRVPPTTGLSYMQRPRTAHRALSTEELRRFFAAIPRDTIQGKRDRAIFLTYFYTARRRAEIVRLRWGDIQCGTIIDGAARRSGYIYTFYGKGYGRQIDSAELPGPAYDAIIEYLHDSGRKATIQANDPVFTTTADYHGQKGHDPQRPLHAVTIWHLTKHYAEKAGLDPNCVTVHSFRHTSARMRFEGGSDVREVQHLLRHKNLATTDVYLRELTTVSDPGATLLENQFGDL